jgi:hypothetical protein
LQILLNHALAEILRDDEDTDNNPTLLSTKEKRPGQATNIAKCLARDRHYRWPAIATTAGQRSPLSLSLTFVYHTWSEIGCRNLFSHWQQVPSTP